MSTMSKHTHFAIMILSLGAVLGTAQLAQAMPNHPRRTEVNARLTVQKWRINQAYKQGEISLAEDKTLHADDRAIRRQERLDARFDGGHITRPEQKALNQLENGVSRQIP
jgi:hypothetical protein